MALAAKPTGSELAEDSHYSKDQLLSLNVLDEEDSAIRM